MTEPPALPPRFHPLPEAIYRRWAEADDALLLESSRPDLHEHRSWLFTEPERVLQLRRPDDVGGFLAEAEAWRRRGFHLAGFLAYEAGYPLVGVRLPAFAEPPELLGWLGVYRRPLRFDHLSGRLEPPGAVAAPPTVLPTALPTVLPTALPTVPPETPLGAGRFGLEPDEHARLVARVRAYLEAGDCYQVNLTDRVHWPQSEPQPEPQPDPHAAGLLPRYRRLLAGQRVSYGALLRTAELELASLSPELFFAVERHPHGRRIRARPMKGTAERGRTPEEDAERAARLAADPKSRAENVMITDLLRNDLGRLCAYGSVRVPRLFEVERYPTLLQLTSTVEGELRPEVALPEVFAALFPCGSVTGAPKRRAMQIIAELERHPRGPYTGAIGHVTPDGEMRFSVAIRTLVQRPAGSAGSAPDGAERPRLTLGVGGGLVLDSRADDEYRECLLKARFATHPEAPFELFETLRWQAETLRWQAETLRGQAGYRWLDDHLARLARSAAHFRFPFAPERARALLHQRARDFAAPDAPGGAWRVKLRLDSGGGLRVEARPFRPAVGPGLPQVALAADPVHSGDPLLYHKTTRRERYDAARQRAEAAGLADLLFVNERGECTEGAISNLFVQLDGRLWTPPVTCGLLPGVARARLLAERPDCGERTLTPDDLLRADALYLCSSLRGLRRVRLRPDPKLTVTGSGSTMRV